MRSNTGSPGFVGKQMDYARALRSSTKRLWVRNSKHYRRANAHIVPRDIYSGPMESVKICRFKTFWVRIFARESLLQLPQNVI